MTSDYLYQKPIFLTLIRELEGQIYKKHLKIKGKSLDFGSGDGFFASQFFPKKIDIGVDVDPQTKILAENSGSYKKVIIYDGKKLPFPDSSFDTVVSNCVLEHIPNLDQNLKEIYRLLKPNGIFYNTVMESRWEDYLLGKLLLGNFYLNWMRKKQIHHNLFSEENWSKKFGSTGFKVVYSQVYLTRRLCQLIDIFHYLGVPNLISNKLFGKWVLFPRSRKLFPLNAILDWGKKDATNPGGAVFYILEKPAPSNK